MGGINGVESIVYGVENLDLCVHYFTDFGLQLIEREEERSALFELEHPNQPGLVLKASPTGADGAMSNPTHMEAYHAAHSAAPEALIGGSRGQ